MTLPTENILGAALLLAGLTAGGAVLVDEPALPRVAHQSIVRPAEPVALHDFEPAPTPSSESVNARATDERAHCSPQLRAGLGRQDDVCPS